MNTARCVSVNKIKPEENKIGIFAGFRVALTIENSVLRILTFNYDSSLTKREFFHVGRTKGEPFISAIVLSTCRILVYLPVQIFRLSKAPLPD